MVNFKFAKFHCYQQTQSFLITPYYNHGRKKKGMQKSARKKFGIIIWSFQYGTGQDSLAGAEQAIKNEPGT
jgi:hypothetical protein